jgi:hypothetical protein
MIRTWLRRLSLASTVAVLPACAFDPVEAAPQTPIDLALDFCSDQMPVWFGFQNEGQVWQRLLPDGDGTFRFTANNFVTVAWVLQNGADYATTIIGARNAELEEISGVACLEAAGTKQINGTFTGATGSLRALISMLFSSAFPLAQQTSYSLTQLADRPLDLVASRVNLTATAQASDRIIIRRNLNLVNNATVPELDFAGPEAVEPQTVAVVITGLTGGEAGTMFNNFFSQLRTSHTLFFSQVSSSGQISVPAVPSEQTAAGDYHDVFINVNSTDGASFRGVEQFFRTATDVILALGPMPPAAPRIDTETSNPYLRLSASMEAGSYSSAASFRFSQQFGQSSVTTMTVTVTAGFYEGSGVEPWFVLIPDFSTTDGWQNAWGLQPGTPVDWQTTSYLGRPTLVMGASPTEGETISFAGRLSLQPFQPSVLSATAPRRQSSVRGP